MKYAIFYRACLLFINPCMPICLSIIKFIEWWTELLYYQTEDGIKLQFFLECSYTLYLSVCPFVGLWLIHWVDKNYSKNKMGYEICNFFPRI